MRAEKNTNTSDHVDPWTEVVKLLLENGAQINARDEEGRTPLIEAASYSRFATVKVLLERGADLEASDNHGNTALLAAACDCAIAPMPDTDVIVELLMKRGANINARNNDAETPLMIASYGGVVKTRIIEILVEHGANLRLKNRDGDTALMIARKSDVPDVVRLLEGALAQPH
jgi:ankyrin repeat protein